MTAEPRDVEAAVYDDVYTELSLALGTDDTADEDVDFKRDLTARIMLHFAAADRENAELRGEVERLRELVARQLGDCIGCSPETGPEETCPHDGRTYAEWVDIASMVIGRQHDDAAERDDLRAQLAAAQAQLAEARAAHDIDLAEEVTALDAAEARLEAVRACIPAIKEWIREDGDIPEGSIEISFREIDAALSAAPQPEPDDEYVPPLSNEPWPSKAMVESVNRLTSQRMPPEAPRIEFEDDEPPASDEPTGRSD